MANTKDLGNLLEGINDSNPMPEHMALVQSDFFRAMRIKIPKGTNIPPHPEDSATLFYVLKGEGIFTIDGQKIRAKEHSAIYVEAGGDRGIEAIETLLLLGIQDFKKE